MKKKDLKIIAVVPMMTKMELAWTVLLKAARTSAATTTVTATTPRPEFPMGRVACSSPFLVS